MCRFGPPRREGGQRSAKRLPVQTESRNGARTPDRRNAGVSFALTQSRAWSGRAGPRFAHAQLCKLGGGFVRRSALQEPGEHSAYEALSWQAARTESPSDDSSTMKRPLRTLVPCCSTEADVSRLRHQARRVVAARTHLAARAGVAVVHLEPPFVLHLDGVRRRGGCQAAGRVFLGLAACLSLQCGRQRRQRRASKRAAYAKRQNRHPRRRQPTRLEVFDVKVPVADAAHVSARAHSHQHASDM